MTRLRFDETLAVRPEGVPAGSVVTVFRVPPESAGMRLDVFLHGQLHRTSRTRAQTIVRNSAYSPEGSRMRPNDRVRAEQRVLLWRAPWDETPVPTELPVLYEDDDLLAISKPAGVPVHPTARYHHNTVVKLLAAERPGETLRLSHRLDRETSGVLLLAKHHEADRRVKVQLADRDGVEKRYVALVWGAPERDELRVDVPLELDPTARIPVKMRVAAPGEGLTAATRFTVLGRAGARERPYAAISCDLETGRQHQIRVHLASIGCPVVGDKLYGPDETIFARGADGALTDDDRAKLELERHALHAAHLGIEHPFTGRRLDIDAPVPADMVDFWERIAGG